MAVATSKRLHERVSHTIENLIVFGLRARSGRHEALAVLSAVMTKAALDLGFLELGNVVTASPARGFCDVIAYAKQIELSGFKRLWLGEHQGENNYWGSPEIPLAIIARETTTVNVGTAGVLVAFHNPLHLASNFCFLEHTFPGRIDLGLARGIPTLAGNKQLLGGADAGMGFEKNVRLVLELLKETDTPSSTEARVLPRPPRSPRLWMLGSGSGTSQRLAHDLSLEYIHALFFRGSRDPEEWLPIHAIAVAGFCHHDKLACESFARNYDGPFHPMAVGDPETVYTELTKLAQRRSVNEVVFLDLAPSFEHKLQTVRELAECL